MENDRHLLYRVIAGRTDSREPTGWVELGRFEKEDDAKRYIEKIADPTIREWGLKDHVCTQIAFERTVRYRDEHGVTVAIDQLMEAYQ